jgi:prevent-host-death family protein
MVHKRSKRSEVSASELKAHCAEIVERVAARREVVTITRRGRPVARIVPVEQESRSLFGFARGALTVRGDILGPIDVAWEASE